ncbi:MAG TPA: hypothetical protein VMF62_04540 [Acetobacteraceae bacterium]|nr:hypothetical protein [Acetobacteraceae bacterium]
MAEEVIETLSLALRFEGWKPVHHADSFMARIAAERLLEYLERAGFVVMKRPPAVAPRVSLPACRPPSE